MHPVAKKLGLTSDRFEGKELSENAEYYIKKAKKKDRPGMKTKVYLIIRVTS
jgi:hypothetical protein